MAFNRVLQLGNSHRTLSLSTHREQGRQASTWAADMPVHAERLQPERVLSLWNHGQRNEWPVWFCVQMAGFQPRAQPGIEDVRRVLPEIRPQSALNLEMPQLQLDAGNVFGKITPDIVHAHMKPNNSVSIALRPDHHASLPAMC
jgi:hypothetical protein